MGDEFKIWRATERKQRNFSQSGKSSKRPEKRLDVLDNCSSTENNSSSVTSTIDTTNILDTATYTGTTSTITPAIPSTDNETISTIIINYDNNSSNNNSQAIVYEEESLAPNSIDETFLTTEDYEFVESIRSPTFSGVCLPLFFYDPSNYTTTPVTTLANQDDLVIPSQALVENSQKVSFIKLYFDATNSHILNEENSNSRLLFYIINMYVIFVWDPGIF